MQDSSKVNVVKFWVFVLFFLIALKLYVVYFPYFLFGYLVPPGDDAVNHISYVNSILEGRSGGVSYPLMFHYLIAFFVKITGFSPLKVITWSTPLLTVLPGLAVYYFLKKSFNFESAVLGFAIVLFGSNYPILALGDGNYPNLLAGGFLVPLALLMVLLLYNKWSLKRMFLLLVLIVLIALTHHLSLAIFVAIASIFSIIMAVYAYYLREVYKSYKLILLSTVVVIVLLSFGIYLSPAKALFADAFKSFINGASFVTDRSMNRLPMFHEYSEVIGGLVWHLGLISILYLTWLIQAKGASKKNRHLYLFIITWFFVLLIMTRLSLSGLPLRIVRELSLPLIVAIGLSVADIIKRIELRNIRMIYWGAFSLLILSSMSQVNGGSHSAPEFFNKMVWFDRKDKAVADSINKLEEEGAVMSNRISPYLNFFTNRDVLYPNLNNINSSNIFSNYIEKNNIKYILIGEITSANPDKDIYPFFRNFETITKQLNELVGESKPVTTIYGSSIYKVK